MNNILIFIRLFAAFFIAIFLGHIHGELVKMDRAKYAKTVYYILFFIICGLAGVGGYYVFRWDLRSSNRYKGS